MNLTPEELNSRMEERIDKLVAMRNDIRQLVAEYNKLSQGMLNATLNDHGLPMEGQTITINGKEQKVLRGGFNRMELTTEQQYPILVGKKKNGDWSKKSSGVSFPWEYPSWARYGHLLWGNWS